MKAPIHPGRILLEDWLQPFDISQNGLARHIGVPPRRINEIVLGKRAITADTAIRLADALGTRPQYWMALQADYELALAGGLSSEAMSHTALVLRLRRGGVKRRYNAMRHSRK